MANKTVGDPYNLQRFVDAQASCYESARAELCAGYKRSHWMWFIFPQMKGLGSSELAHRFGIASRAEAEAYLRHPVLGPRLRECAQLVNLVQERSVDEILGYPDNMKFRSCMTLFAHATSDNEVFLSALHKYFDGKFDRLTLDLMEAQEGAKKGIND